MRLHVHTRYFTTCALAAFTTLAACTGSGVGLDANGHPITSGGTSSGPLTANFQSIQDNVFTPICTRCHIGASAPQGLMLDAAHSYSLLVGVPSNEVPSLQRVKPGDPDNSYLILKLQGSTGIVGGQMPLGGPYLPQSTIDVIRQWITDGATQSAAAPTGTNSPPMAHSAQRPSDLVKLVVTATAPMDGSTVPGSVARILIAFNDELDISLVNDTAASLVRLADGPKQEEMAFEKELLQPVKLSLPVGNPAALMMTPAVPLGNGRYRVTLHGEGSAGLADIGGHPLGSDYSFSFTVDDAK